MIDPAYAKKQLDIMTREWYMKPDGALPAYEWNFSDVNPPVHAWLVLLILISRLRLTVSAQGYFPSIQDREEDARSTGFAVP